MDGLRDLILPRTDAGAWAQLALIVASLAVAVAGLRHHPDVRLLLVGVGVVLLVLAGLRAAH